MIDLRVQLGLGHIGIVRPRRVARSALMQKAAQAAETASEFGEPATATRALALDDPLLAVRKDQDDRLTLAQGAEKGLARIGGV